MSFAWQTGLTLYHTESCNVAVQGHMLPHSMPLPVRLAWPQMAYAPGLSMPVPLHMLAAQFPQAYSAAAGERPQMCTFICCSSWLLSMVSHHRCAECAMHPALLCCWDCVYAAQCMGWARQRAL